MTASEPPRFPLDRRAAVPALIGRHEDFLIVAGLAGTARDIAALTGDSPNVFTMAGAMGGAQAIGLGLALAQPSRPVLVVTGDGELLMNIGTLATIAVLNPPNLSILCVDNGHYGETGNQESHTTRGTRLDRMAEGAGIAAVRRVETEADIAEGARALRAQNAASFVLLKVNDGPPAAFKRNLDPALCRARFKDALLGHGWANRLPEIKREMSKDPAKAAERLAARLADRGQAQHAESLLRALAQGAERTGLVALREACQTVLSAVEAFDPETSAMIEELRLSVDRCLGTPPSE